MTIDDLIANINGILDSGYREMFVPGRWPYTYAFDFVRAHPLLFGFDGIPSRSDVSEWLHETFPDNSTFAAELLAEAYMEEDNVIIEPKRDANGVLRGVAPLRCDGD